MRSSTVFSTLVAINFMNFLDRGIIPGSIEEFNMFIKSTIMTNSPDVFLGILQSSFVFGIIIGSLLFGYLTHYYGRLFLISVGCSIWIFSALLAAISYSSSSFLLLLFARILSGFGEASLCTVPPWIQDFAPPEMKETWLSIFYTALPVGIAVGYAYSSFISSKINWQWCFLIESIFSFPLVAFIFYCSTQESQSPGVHSKSTIEMTSISGPVTYSLAENNSDELIEINISPSIHGSEVDEFPVAVHSKRSFFLEIFSLLSNLSYVSFVLGNAAQTATLMGVSTFGSAFMLGLGIFATESESSTMFGILISIAGVVGTPIGGLLIDRITNNMNADVDSSISEEQRKEIIRKTHLRGRCIMIYWSSFIGTLLLCSLYFIRIKGFYLAVVTIGCAFIFMTTSAITSGIMISVESERRAFAIGVSTVCIHAFGDVPSPIITGYLKDWLAPGCTASASRSSSEGDVSSSPSCRQDEEGLRMTMFIVFAWCYFSVIFFWIAWRLTLRSI